MATIPTALITRETFLSLPVVTTSSITVGDLGTLRVRELTIGEGKQLAAEYQGKDAEAAEYILRRCLVDEAGKPLLTSDDKIDGIGVATVRTIVDAVLELSGLRAKQDPAPKA